jgi:RNA polymerase sigma-70 factor, ECF subfamily
VDRNSPTQEPVVGDPESETASAYQDHGSALLRYATQLTGSSELARDAVQEAFLRFFMERRFGRIIDNPRAWLYRVAHNYASDHLKAAPTHREVAVDLDAVADLQYESPEQTIERRQAARRIRSALTPREFLCLSLRSEGFTYAEIAGAMNIQPGTVGALLARVQDKLRPPEARDEPPHHLTRRKLCAA